MVAVLVVVAGRGCRDWTIAVHDPLRCALLCGASDGAQASLPLAVARPSHCAALRCGSQSMRVHVSANAALYLMQRRLAPCPVAATQLLTVLAVHRLAAQADTSRCSVPVDVALAAARSAYRVSDAKSVCGLSRSAWGFDALASESSPVNFPGEGNSGNASGPVTGSTKALRLKYARLVAVRGQ